MQSWRVGSAGPKGRFTGDPFRIPRPRPEMAGRNRYICLRNPRTRLGSEGLPEQSAGRRCNSPCTKEVRKIRVPGRCPSPPSKFGPKVWPARAGNEDWMHYSAAANDGTKGASVFAPANRRTEGPGPRCSGRRTERVDLGPAGPKSFFNPAGRGGGRGSLRSAIPIPWRHPSRDRRGSPPSFRRGRCCRS